MALAKGFQQRRVPGIVLRIDLRTLVEEQLTDLSNVRKSTERENASLTLPSFLRSAEN